MTTTKIQTDKTKNHLRDQVKELEENWKRALADYQNLTKRVEKERWEAVLFATGSLLSKILKIADDLRLAVAPHPDQPWLKLIHADLTKILKDEGISEIDAAAKPFDPQTMECVQQVDGPKNTIVKVVQMGYKLHDKILRPAGVEVGKGEETNQSLKH